MTKKEECASAVPIFSLPIITRVLVNCLVVPSFDVSQAQVTTSITGNTVSGASSTQIVPPSPGGHVYGIQGGYTAGTNLFHSFGQFNVGSGDVAQFQTSTLTQNTSISNILGRVNGQQSPSQIFGTIDSATFYPSANLFMMNPYGFLFGPNATVNVGGMMTFTSADYLRLQGAGGDGIFYANSAANSVLTSAPVAAFGFLGSNPGAITVQGSQFTVTEGTGISLVGGNITIQSGVLDDGVTVQPAHLSAPGGQINLASVASPGEVLNPSFNYGPNVNGAQFTSLGNTSLSEGALIDVSSNAAGTVHIRGGQLTIDNATISANTGDTDGAPVAIDINVTGAVSLSSTQTSALTATTSGAGNAGDIVISSGSLNATFGTPSIFVPLIDTHTTGTGHGGNVTITTGPLTVNTNNIFVEGHEFIISGTAGDGNGGNVAITAGDSQFSDASIDTGMNVFGGGGSGGNLSVKATSLVLNNSSWGTDALGATAGAINLESSGLMQMNDSFISSTSLLGANPVTVKADQFVLNNTLFLSGTAFADAGDFNVTARIVELANTGVIGTQTFGDGNAGNVHITASESLTINGSTTINPPSGIFTSSFGDPDLGFHGNAGQITISTPQLVLTNGAQINSTTFNSAGRGGDVTIHANSVSITGERPPDSGEFFFMTGSTRASGIYTNTLGSDVCSASCGNAGIINIVTGSLTLQNGGLLNSGSSNSGSGGIITVSAADKIQISGTMLDGTPGGIFSESTGTGTDPVAGNGGNISLTAGQSVTISNGAAVSASSTGPGATGNITINAGNQFVMTNSSVTTEADQSSGGSIKISTNPSGTVQLTDSTISASVLDGTGDGGSVNIDPQYVVLQNSQILANAVFGPGGNIFITTNLLLQDATSVISASSQFGQNGTITIQSPINPAGGKIIPLSQKPLIATALLSQRCAALAGGNLSSFTVAGRDSLPAEPGNWLSSPLAIAQLESGSGTLGDAGNSGRNSQPAGEIPLLSLRQIAPAGFLTQTFAVDWSAGCTS